jgi:deoxyribodipyrimidine photo-lyase
MFSSKFSMQVCSGSREEALVLLAAFLPKAGTSYTRNRNFDLGAGQHKHVSQLSAYIKRRIITEEDVLKKVLSAHSLNEAESSLMRFFGAHTSRDGSKAGPIFGCNTAPMCIT